MMRQGVEESVLPCSLIQPISKAKYPAITEGEEQISVPLSCLCLAIFDAILVHLMWKLSGNSGDWQELRSSIRTALGDNKVRRSLDILDHQYKDCEIIFLQECSAACIAALEAHPSISSRYAVIIPSDPEALLQDQNSVVLASKAAFDFNGVNLCKDVNDVVFKQFPADNKSLGAGDLASVVLAASHGGKLPPGQRLLIASFHGDTNGLHSVPAVTAVKGALDELNKEPVEASGAPIRVVIGTDANTYNEAKSNKFLNVQEFKEKLIDMGLTTCWGDNAHTVYTTFHARTYLQPQLNKAVSRADLKIKGDANCKDHVLIESAAFVAGSAQLDNTGKGPGQFIEDIAFPTLDFPSDHAIISCSLNLIVC